MHYHYLKVKLNIVYKKRHVKAGTRDPGPQTGLGQFFQTDLQAQTLVQLHLDAANKKQISEDFIVLL